MSLTDNPNIKKVYICFDNDKAGHLASDRIIPKLKELNYIAERLVPNEKDWNEDLLNEIEEMDVCQMEQLC